MCEISSPRRVPRVFVGLGKVAEGSVKELSDEGRSGEEDAQDKDEEGALHVDHSKSLRATRVPSFQDPVASPLTLPSSLLGPRFGLRYGISDPLLV